jgi:hypothetical protein
VKYKQTAANGKWPSSSGGGDGDSVSGDSSGAEYDYSDNVGDNHMSMMMADDYDEDENIDERAYEILNTTTTKLKVGNTLKPFTLYEFRVSAVNLLGKSDDSQPLFVRTAATSNSRIQIYTQGSIYFSDRVHFIFIFLQSRTWPSQEYKIRLRGRRCL